MSNLRRALCWRLACWLLEQIPPDKDQTSIALREDRSGKRIIVAFAGAKPAARKLGAIVEGFIEGQKKP